MSSTTANSESLVGRFAPSPTGGALKTTPSGKPLIGRFAPSPTGRMHAGNIYAALVAWIVAKRSGGHMVLRIEDLDPDRSKAEYIDAIQRDFEYLGLTWEGAPLFQSKRSAVYAEAFHSLQKRGLTYACYCTRADLHAASAPHRGEKPVYPGTCRKASEEQLSAWAKTAAEQGREPAVRLMVPNQFITVDDLFQGTYRQNLQEECGDFLIRRSDGAFAYQLAVVIDDAAQGVTSVVRGVDLLCSTPQQMYLQRLLGLSTECAPQYGHVPLLVSQQDRRLSKRDHDANIEVLKTKYGTPSSILGHIAFVAGLIPKDEPATAAELLTYADLSALNHKIQIPWS